LICGDSFALGPGKADLLATLIREAPLAAAS